MAKKRNYKSKKSHSLPHHSATSVAVADRENNATKDKIVTLFNEQQYRKSTLLCVKSLRTDCHNATVLNLLAINLSMLKKYKFAEAAFSYLCDAEPTNLSYLNNLATTYLLRHNIGAAIHLYHKMVDINPQDLDLYFRIIRAYQLQNNKLFATEYTNKALHIAIDNGRANYEAGDFKLALYYFQQAVILSPDNPALYNNLGCIYQALNQLDNSIKHFKQAISFQPDDFNAHTNLAFSLLKQGNFTDGWREYEWRLRKPEILAQLKTIAVPKWTGENLDHKTLLIISEQGFGDTLQFCRYIPLINKGNGKIIFACPSPLTELMQTLPNCDEIQSIETAQGNADAYIFVMSLPFIFLNLHQSIPAHVPYLTPSSAKIAKFNSYFSAAKNKLKVGFSWRVKVEKSTSKERSCSLELFLQLTKQFKQIQFYCLQRDIPELKFAKYKNIINLSHEIHNFADTAAAVSQLDLVISIDTALVHLAGALNKPIWTLLPYVADWRWLQDRSDSHWYPTMRLYRQPDPDNWQAVFASVAKDLINF